MTLKLLYNEVTSLEQNFVATHRHALWLKTPPNAFGPSPQSAKDIICNQAPDSAEFLRHALKEVDELPNLLEGVVIEKLRIRFNCVGMKLMFKTVIKSLRCWFDLFYNEPF